MTKSKPEGPDYGAWTSRELDEVRIGLTGQAARLVASVASGSPEAILIGVVSGVQLYSKAPMTWHSAAAYAAITVLGIARLYFHRCARCAKRTKGAKTAPSKSGDDG